MATLMDASRNWATRPPEERFTSLRDMHASLLAKRSVSHAGVVASRSVRAVPTEDNAGLLIEGPRGHQLTATHWSFGQLAQLAGAPAGYMRELPAPLAADCLNYGLQVSRDVQDVGVLMSAPPGSTPVLRAATGPRYGRVWNSDIVGALVDHFGDGVTGDWRVPGEYGRAVQVTAANTTLFASDRDCFIFLADEEHRVELPNRRDGRTGSLARGFFISNSEEGSATLSLRGFLFDYVCANRIVWGAQNLQEIAIRHTASAPARFVEEVAPALISYAGASTGQLVDQLQAAQAAKLHRADEWLAGRFGPRVAARMQAAHVEDEGRPVETLWDAVTAATAYARSIPWTADRVELESQAGKLLDAVAV